MVRARSAVLLAALLVVAGCSGPADRTPQPLEGTAAAATVDSAALSETGYETVDVSETRVNRSGTLEVSGDVALSVDYRVRATAQRAVYRSTGGDQPAVFAVHSAPLVSPDAVSVDVDPLGDRSTAAVLEHVQGVYGDVGALEPLENDTATLLGTETTVARYGTTARVDGDSVEVVVSVAVVEHEGDVVRAVAVVPRSADDPAVVRRLLAGVEH